MIKLYSSENCIWCKKMKQYLKSKDIAFEEFNIRKPQNAERVYQLSGQNAVPVTVIGSHVIVGFDSTAVDRAVEKSS